MTEAGYWTKELRRMYDQHYPELDHKDCANIADLLEEMKGEIDRLERINKGWAKRCTQNALETIQVEKERDEAIDRGRRWYNAHQMVISANHEIILERDQLKKELREAEVTINHAIEEGKESE